MIKVTILYNRTDDPDSFDSYYFSVHAPLARTLEGLGRLEVSEVSDVDQPVHLIAELWFADEAAMDAAFASQIGIAVRADVPKFSLAGATRLVSRVLDA